MEAETKQTSPVAQTFDFYKWAAWFHANLKQVIAAAAVLAVVGSAIGIYNWKKDGDEALANQTFFNLPPAPGATNRVARPAAESLLAVASQFPGTSMGQQAELLAAKTFFTNGKYEDAQRAYYKYLTAHENSPFAAQAAVGVAASLEAQNKIPEATQAYKDALAKYSGSGISGLVRSTLARLSEDQKQYEQALRYYDELTAANQFDVWAQEARERKADLLAKHPELAKAATVAPAPAAPVKNAVVLPAGGPAAKPAPAPAPAAPVKK